MTIYRLRRIAILLIVLRFFPLILFAGGIHYVGTSAIEPSPELVFCRGDIALVGNEPYPTLIIRYIDSESQRQKEYALAGDCVIHLRIYQQEYLEVVGSIKSPEVSPGFPAVLEVLYFRKPHGQWLNSAGEDVDVPEEITTDENILLYFASKEKNKAVFKK